MSDTVPASRRTIRSSGEGTRHSPALSEADGSVEGVVVGDIGIFLDGGKRAAETTGSDGSLDVHLEGADRTLKVAAPIEVRNGVE